MTSSFARNAVRGVIACAFALCSLPLPAETWGEVAAKIANPNPLDACVVIGPGTIQATSTIAITSDLCIQMLPGTVIQSDPTPSALKGAPFTVFHVRNSADVIFEGGEIRGTLVFDSGTTARIVAVRFILARQAGNGGAIDFRGRRITILASQFSGNSAGVFGCDLNLDTTGAGPNYVLVSNYFGGTGCDNVRIENPIGIGLAAGNTISAGGSTANLFDSTSDAYLLGDIFDPIGSRAACRDFNSDAFHSLGYNLNRDTSCFTNGPPPVAAKGYIPPLTSAIGDLVAPFTLGPMVDGVPSLPAGSPAIERGMSTTYPYAGEPTLPCGYRDARGLGRPQDADLDGVYKCDGGAYEVQGGPDIGAPQTAAFFDTGRNGEGNFVEILDGGLALVATFTYRPDARAPAWIVGLGKRVGNSVVVDQMLRTTGGAFGSAFNPANIRKTVVGSASLVFSNCESSTAPGRFMFQAHPKAGFADLMTQAYRLSTVLPCAGSGGALAGRSGSYFAPTRSGEGIFTQFLANGQVVVVWYTYDPAGNQFWIVSGSSQVTGNRVVLDMLYPAQSTRFGANFNPSEVTLAPWGTVTLDFTGCDSLHFSYASTVAGYGTGGYDYVRLSKPMGTSCPP